MTGDNALSPLPLQQPMLYTGVHTDDCSNQLIVIYLSLSIAVCTLANGQRNSKGWRPPSPLPLHYRHTATLGLVGNLIARKFGFMVHCNES